MKFIKDFSRGTRAADVNRPRKPRTQIAGGCMEEKIRLEMRKIADLIPYEHNAKLHPPEQIQKLVGSFDEFGRIVPAGIDDAGNLIYGHGRILAALARGDEEFPCVVISHLTETQRRAFVHADNLLSQSDTDQKILQAEMAALQAAGFDVRITGFDPDGLQLSGDDGPTPFWGDVETESSEEYEEFVEKFKPKLTTDDVYTPDLVYDAIKGWALDHYDLHGAKVVRPFYPGADYKSADYPDGCVVIDNPPFSILSEICRWYVDQGIRFFLFAPGLTLFSIASGEIHYLPIGVSITYTNGASISTSFVTNLGEYRIELCPDLYQAVDAANTEVLKSMRGDPLPVYDYPHCVASVQINKLVKYGQSLQIRENEAAFIRALDAQKENGKAIFGGGFLLSQKAAAEKAAAVCWALSDREKALQESLGGGADG